MTLSVNPKPFRNSDWMYKLVFNRRANIKLWKPNKIDKFCDIKFLLFINSL